MKPLKQILLPFDFSDCASDALTYAADLAKHYDATLYIVYVDQPLTYDLPAGYRLGSKEQMAEIRSRFEHDVASAKHAALSAGAPRVETEVLRGNAVSELVRYAKQGKFDLIVMGTHGRTGLGHVLLGSVAENLVRTAPCPVLAVRATPSE